METLADSLSETRKSRRWGLVLFTAFALPVLAAVWFVPYFVSQDGPLHLLNAHITLELLKHNPTLDSLYAVRWDPLPYWSGHLILTGLLSVAGERIADRTLLTLTSIGFAAAIVWLRWRVAGWQGMEIVAPLAIALSLSMLWLLGLYSFLLGAGLMIVTMGVWWSWRDEMTLKRALALAALLVLGYFTHLVSLGLTVLGIGVLAVATPGVNRGRVKWTVASLVPLAPLAVLYHRMMRTGGAVEIDWGGMDDLLSLRSWFNYARGVDFLQIRAEDACLPFSGAQGCWYAYFGPARLVQLAFVVLLAGALVALWKGVGRERRGWLILAIVLGCIGLFGPDSFGSAHGSILRERVLLVAVSAAIPALNLRHDSRVVRACGIVLMVAAVLQVLFVWEYALYSNRVVSDFMRAKPFVGSNQRIEVVQIDVERPFRANPLHNLSSALGIGTDNVVWNNYGPCLYYFPLRFADAEVGRRALSISDASIFRFKNYDEADHLAWYERQLSETRDQIDALVVVGSHPEVDRINARWYGPEPVFQSGSVRVFRLIPNRD